MESNFDKMFYDGEDDSDRPYEPIDTITVRRVHSWNWDALMEQAIIYSFMKYWENDGEGMLDTYDTEHHSDSSRRWLYRGLKACHNLIMNNNEMFFGDHVANKCRTRYKVLDFLWKYRGAMWN
jgi:hypothetical protein